MTDTDYSTEVTAVVNALNAVYENKQANKKNSLSGDYSSDDESYPTCQAVKGAYGTRVTSWQAYPSDSNIPSELLVKSTINNLDADDIAYDNQHSVGDILDEYGSAIGAKASKTNGAGEITDSNAANYTNIGTFTSSSKQSDINSALNTIIGTLKGTKFIEIVDSLPIPSASTMGKLYIITENNKVNVYYTKQVGSGSSAIYAMVEMDANILDDLTDATTSIHGLMSASDKTKLNALDAMVDATQSTHGWMSTSDKIKLDKSIIKEVQLTSYDVANAGSGKIRLIASTTPDLAHGSVYRAVMSSTLRSQIISSYGSRKIQLYTGSSYEEVATYVGGTPRLLTVDDFWNMEFLILSVIDDGEDNYSYCHNFPFNQISDIFHLRGELDSKAGTTDMVHEIGVFASQLAEAINPSS